MTNERNNYNHVVTMIITTKHFTFHIQLHDRFGC